ncbi:MAG: flagellar hook-length control protein FliK [Treponema sp.]|jgi:hypothetical protein|nr:flagellar hook-length control protein FliK [Treponema sp.]
MVTIEHNPTHIQTEAPPEPGIRLEASKKKGRKNDGLGIFGKLLAGLTGKKAGPKPETAGAARREAAGTAGTEKADIPLPAAGKLKNSQGKGNLLFAAGTEQKAASAPAVRAEKRERELGSAGLSGREQLVPGPGAEPLPAADFAGMEEEAGHTLASMGTGGEEPSKGREIPERVFPFRNQEIPELPLQGEVRNTTFRVKNGEPSPAENQESRPVFRKGDRRREKIPLDIQDLRTGTADPAEGFLKWGSEIRNGTEEIVLDLRPAGERSEPPLSAEEWQAARAGEGFEQILARELKGELSADIVRQAALVLRDGGEGTIKLSLKPETLGKVKIHLEMADNKILGYIVVESEEALRAFEQEIHSLEQSFRDSGFADASLNAALDYRNGGQRRRDDEADPFFSERLAASSYDAEADRGQADISGGYGSSVGFNAVNVLA